MENNIDSKSDCSFTSANEIENNDPLSNLFDKKKQNANIDENFFDEAYSGRKTISFDNRFEKKFLNNASIEKSSKDLKNDDKIKNQIENDSLFDVCFGRNTISFENNQFRKKANLDTKKEENIFTINEDQDSLDFDHKNLLNRLGIEDIADDEVEDNENNNDSGYFKSILKEIQEEEIKRNRVESEDIIIANTTDKLFSVQSNENMENKNQVMVLVSELKDEINTKSINSHIIKDNNNTTNSNRNTLEFQESSNKEEHDMKTRFDLSMSKRTTTNSLNNNLNNNVLIQSFSYCNNNNIRHTYDYGVNHNIENTLRNNTNSYQEYSMNSMNQNFNPYGSLQMNSNSNYCNNQIINSNDNGLNSRSLPFNFINTNISGFHNNFQIPINMPNYYNQHQQYYSPQVLMNNMISPMININTLPGLYSSTNNFGSNFQNTIENEEAKSKKKKKIKKTTKNKTKKITNENHEDEDNHEDLSTPILNNPYNNKFDLIQTDIANEKKSMNENVLFYINMNDDKFIQSVNTKDGSKAIQSILDFYINNNLQIPLDFFMKFIKNNIFTFMNDRYGNYVLDRLIILMELKYRKILYEDENFKKKFVDICCGIYSNIVIQKLIKTMKSPVYEEEKIIELIIENIDQLYNNKMANLCFHTIFDIFTVESSSKIVNILTKRLVKIVNYNKFGHYLAKNFIITFKKKYDLYMKDVRLSYSKKNSKKNENEGNGKFLYLFRFE